MWTPRSARLSSLSSYMVSKSEQNFTTEVAYALTESASGEGVANSARTHAATPSGVASVAGAAGTLRGGRMPWKQRMAVARVRNMSPIMTSSEQSNKQYYEYSTVESIQRNVYYS